MYLNELLIVAHRFPARIACRFVLHIIRVQRFSYYMLVSLLFGSQSNKKVYICQSKQIQTMVKLLLIISLLSMFEVNIYSFLQLQLISLLLPFSASWLCWVLAWLQVCLFKYLSFFSPVPDANLLLTVNTAVTLFVFEPIVIDP